MGDAALEGLPAQVGTLGANPVHSGPFSSTVLLSEGFTEKIYNSSAFVACSINYRSSQNHKIN